MGKGKSFFVISGIGNPKSFKETLFMQGLEVRGFKSYGDHYRYNTTDMRKITEASKKSNAGWIVTTEKDIMRLKKLDIRGNLVALAIEFRIDEGFYEEVFRQ